MSKDNSKGEKIYNKYNPLSSSGLIGGLSTLYDRFFNNGKKSREYPFLGTSQDEAYWAKYNNVNNKYSDRIKNTDIRFEGDSNNDEYVGLLPEMEKHILAMVDSLHLGRLYKSRHYGDSRNLYDSDINPKADLRSAYLNAKKILEDNSGKWHTVNEKLSPLMLFDKNIGDYNYSSGVSALQNFSIRWNKDKKRIEVKDTYDFSPFQRFLTGIPKRDKELQIRGSIPFDPLIGSKELNSSLKKYDMLSGFKNEEYKK